MTTLTSILPNLNDRVVAVHPKSGKKIEVTVTKLLKKSFTGKNKNSLITGFTKWEPADEPKPNPVDLIPAKFKPGDRVRIISSGINGSGTVVAKNSDDPKNNDIYRIVLDGKNESELFPEDDLDNKIVLDFQPGDRVLMLTGKFKGIAGNIVEKTEEDKKTKFFNHLYRIKVDYQEESYLFAKDEFEFLYLNDEKKREKELESTTEESTSIAQKQVDFLSFQNADSIDTSELNKDELLTRAISEHNAIAGIEKEEAKLALFKLSHARNAGIYFKSFKARCVHGEFENSVKSLGVSERVAQNYMQIATFWNCIEAKANCDSLLKECQTQTLSITWALGIIRDEKKSLKSAEPNKEPEQLPLFAPPTEQAITEGSNVEVAEDSYFKGKTGTVTGFTSGGDKAVIRFDPDNDGCSPSGLIDLKSLNLKQTDFNSVAEELDSQAESLGLTNGKSVLPDLRGNDRDRADKLDPTTVDDRPGSYNPVGANDHSSVSIKEETRDDEEIDEEEKTDEDDKEIKEEELDKKLIGLPEEVINEDKTEIVKATNFAPTHINGLPICVIDPYQGEENNDENPHEEDDDTIDWCLNEIEESEDPEYVIEGIIKALIPKYQAVIQKLTLA
jgi:hypothetical protein